MSARVSYGCWEEPVVSVFGQSVSPRQTILACVQQSVIRNNSSCFQPYAVLTRAYTTITLRPDYQK